MAPTSLEEALAVRAERGDEATVLAGGTFLGILMNQGFLAPSALLSLGRQLAPFTCNRVALVPQIGLVLPQLVLELREIAARGFDKLDTRLDDATIDAFAVESAGSPQLMQGICLNACFHLGLRHGGTRSTKSLSGQIGSCAVASTVFVVLYGGCNASCCTIDA